MEAHGVKKEIRLSEAKSRGLKIIRSRWVDVKKALPEDPQGVLGRYLISFPVEEWLFVYQEEPDEFCVYCDSDWAADKKSRKSVSSYSIRYGDHLLDTSCARPIRSFDHPYEAEYYALTRGSSAGLVR